ncbi:MAG: helix-turn-helix domain-containing protein [Streptosporangiales bacterium]|nr:helix-turn-helix domain-containing protein [Streptosporangiales bacterium]
MSIIRQPSRRTTPTENAPVTRGPTMARVMLGTRLQRLRTDSGVSTSIAGTTIRASRSKISRMENGRVGIKVRDVTDLLDLYGVTDETERSTMLALARQSGSPGWWAGYDDVMVDWLQDYIGLEAAASSIRGFELQFVHGLFQTEEYAREVTLLGYSGAPEDEIDRRVDLRIRRQRLLDGPSPPHVWLIIDEGALRRPVGGGAVMRGQLKQLAERADQPGVAVQVVPFAWGAHAAAGGAFTLLRFGENEVPDIVYLEQLTSALYLDKTEDVERYSEAMANLTIAALTPADTRDFIGRMIREA